ncbi:carbohydrate-binding domain-containing protein [Acetivibrio straminisolvens]|uniref:Cellulose 1,4-beta-cellobiosidase n=1 Tax=Acetivibrio straminisolvens JCM 21531 TaxID=1294263 RepID=W4VB65_9FIRM|nr:carbohydrate-binding domain-containing protein [Acetivibrio straminisolvens]GAE90048.1 cellulose 1,4-beta-cellobiosidase [Acetivibrio straminisolvens JCM 21531]
MGMRKKYLGFLLCALTFIVNIIPVSALEPLRYGDLNSDGKVNSTDLTLMNRYILKSYTDINLIRADLNGDGKINSSDYSLLKRYLMRLIDVLPVEITPEPTPSPTPTPTPTAVDEEAWKNNTGTIELGDTIKVSGEGISVNGSVVTITAGGDHMVTGTLNNGMIYVDTTDRVKLRLSGVNIKNPNGPAIYFYNVDKGFITIEKGTVNYLSDGATYTDKEAKAALFSNDDLELKGKGTLYVTGNYKHGIASDDDLIIENGDIYVTAVTDGLHANSGIKIKGGNITVTAKSDAIESEKDFKMTDGTLTLTADDDAIHAEQDLVIDGGEINILKCYEGIESKTTITINGGKINLNSSEDGLNASNCIYINGGELYITSGYDAIDSNGSIYISGGYTLAFGGNFPEGGIDCDWNPLVITGGTLIAAGAPTALLRIQAHSARYFWAAERQTPLSAFKETEQK